MLLCGLCRRTVAIPVRLYYLWWQSQIEIENIILLCRILLRLKCGMADEANTCFIHVGAHTVDREIFAVKIIRVLNFRVKNILPPDSSAM